MWCEYGVAGTVFMSIPQWHARDWKCVVRMEFQWQGMRINHMPGTGNVVRAWNFGGGTRPE